MSANKLYVVNVVRYGSVLGHPFWGENYVGFKQLFSPLKNKNVALCPPLNPAQGGSQIQILCCNDKGMHEQRVHAFLQLFRPPQNSDRRCFCLTLPLTSQKNNQIVVGANIHTVYRMTSHSRETKSSLST